MSGIRGIVGIMCLLGMPAMAWAGGATCRVDQVTLVNTSWIFPVASELTPTSTQLGGASGVLAQAYDESLSVDRVLTRIRIDGCRAMATSAAPAPTAPGSADPAGYTPATAYDNRPWRFNMTQNGKRMTADEFDAWLKARGVRVVGRRDASTTATPPPAASDAPKP